MCQSVSTNWAVGTMLSRLTVEEYRCACNSNFKCVVLTKYLRTMLLAVFFLRVILLPLLSPTSRSAGEESQLYQPLTSKTLPNGGSRSGCGSACVLNIMVLFHNVNPCAGERTCKCKRVNRTSLTTKRISPQSKRRFSYSCPPPHCPGLLSTSHSGLGLQMVNEVHSSIMVFSSPVLSLVRAPDILF